MPLLRDLVDEVVAALTGYTTDLPMRGTLGADISTGDVEFVVQFPSSEQHPVGLVEIGTELLLIESYEPASAVARVPAWGRGQMGTVAQPHDSGAMVTVAPRIPRDVVRRRVNEAVQSVCPPLFGVAVIPEFRTEYRRNLYDLPAKTHRVLYLEYRVSELHDWTRVSMHEVRNGELWVPEERYKRCFVRGLAAVDPGLFLLESEDYETVTGLDDATVDIVHNAVVARLVLAGDLARQATGTVESSARNRDINSGSGAAIARFHMALNEQRIPAESARLAQKYPPQLIRKG